MTEYKSQMEFFESQYKALKESFDSRLQEFKEQMPKDLQELDGMKRSRDTWSECANTPRSVSFCWHKWNNVQRPRLFFLMMPIVSGAKYTVEVCLVRETSGSADSS